MPGHLTNRVDYSWAVGLFVAGLLTCSLCRSLDRAAEQAAIAASDRELAAIDAAAALSAEHRAGHPTLCLRLPV